MRCAADPLQLLPQPALPEVPEPGQGALAGEARPGAAAGAVLPRGLHSSGRAQRSDLAQPAGALRPAVPLCQGDAAGDRRRPAAAGGSNRISRGPPYLAPAVDRAPSPALHRPGRRAVVGPAAVDRLAQPGFLLARPGALGAVSGQVSASVTGSPSGRQAPVPGQDPGAGVSPCLPGTARSTLRQELGGVLQAAFRRAQEGVGVPVALHAPGGDLQRSPPAAGGRSGGLLLPRLDRGVSHPRVGAVGRGAYPPLPATHPARSLRTDPLLRPAGSPQPQPGSRPEPKAPRGRLAGDSPGIAGL